MFELIWNEYLYRPLFNGLIWIYNNWADQNMGWAVVYLTLLLRTALLPLTLIGEYANAKNKDIPDELARLEKELHSDPILRKQEIRRLLKQRRIRPWSKALVLGIQALVLILLYQVFIQGITGERMLQTLYPFMHFPGEINTIFMGFHLKQTHDIVFPGIVMGYLMIEIYIGFKKRSKPLTQSDLAYFILFPAAVFLFLWILPMVKALFILSSMVFSTIVHQLSKLLFAGVKPKEAK